MNGILGLLRETGGSAPPALLKTKFILMLEILFFYRQPYFFLRSENPKEYRAENDCYYLFVNFFFSQASFTGRKVFSSWL